MKWLFVVSLVISSILFCLISITGTNNKNDYYELVYDEDTDTYKYVDIYTDTVDETFMYKLSRCGDKFIECGKDCFDTVTTFQLDKETYLGKFFDNKFINIIMIPVNLIVNLFDFGVYTYNTFSPHPITSSGGGGGGFHGGR